MRGLDGSNVALKRRKGGDGQRLKKVRSLADRENGVHILKKEFHSNNFRRKKVDQGGKGVRRFTWGIQEKIGTEARKNDVLGVETPLRNVGAAIA